MQLDALILELGARGIRIRAQGEALAVHAADGALDEKLRAALRQHKSALLERMRTAVAGDTSIAIPLRPRSQPLPASLAQRSLWVASQLTQNDTAYTLSSAVKLIGALDLAKFRRAVLALVERHEMLRTTFHARAGDVVQEIHPSYEIGVDVEDLGSVSPDDRAEYLRQLTDAEGGRAFDLGRLPLIRFRLVRVDAREHVLILAAHHIITDMWSMRILVSELEILYHANGDTARASLPPLEAQYADFAAWQRDRLVGDRLERELCYWKDTLENAPRLDLRPLVSRRPEGTAKGDQLVLDLGPKLRSQIDEAARELGTTRFALMFTLFAVLLQRFCVQDDVVIGSPFSGRIHFQTESLIGFFVNTLPVRTDLSGNPTLREAAERVGRSIRSAMEHQELSLDQIATHIDSRRRFDRSPFFDVTFALQTAASEPLDSRDVKAESVWGRTDAARFGLETFVMSSAQEFGLLVNFKPDCYEREFVQSLGRCYRQLLAQVSGKVDRPVGELSLLDDEERDRLLFDWNATTSVYPHEASIGELFEEQVSRRGAAVAVVYGDESLTYSELDRQATCLAHWLRGRGVGTDVPVGVLLERSVQMVVGWLAILKAGGAYVPLDPEHPSRRLEFMLSDTGAPVLLTHSGLSSRVPDYSGRVFCLDQDFRDLEWQPGAARLEPAAASNLAYIMYTSGSTGKPKGVAVPHRAVIRLVRGTDYLQLDEADCVVQASNASFDAATFEVWGALLNGARLEGIGRDLALEPRLFGEFLRGRGATALFVTTALFNQLVRKAPGCFSGLRALLFGGEAVDPRAVREALGEGRPRRLLHVYGPTESTTFATWHEVHDVAAGALTVPIGRPIRNTTVYILDARMEPVPVGVPGELYIGGDGLAREYLGQPQLTAEKFVADPFRAEAGARLYRTGDLVRWLPEGAIEFLGRMDDQVKVRGYRIELGEVEAALREHTGVRDAAVMRREDVPGDRRLVAYVVRTPGADLSVAELRGRLREALPEYMVPSAFEFLDAFPLTPNGKLDRSALPAPAGERQVEDAYVAPRGELESRIAGIWRDVLGIERVGAHDNFFDIGGNSLLALEVHERLAIEMDLRGSVTDLFRFPTIHLFASQLAGIGKGPDAVRRGRNRAQRQRQAISERRIVREGIER